MGKIAGVWRRRVTRRALIKAGAGGVVGAMAGVHPFGMTWAETGAPSGGSTDSEAATDVRTKDSPRDEPTQQQALDVGVASILVLTASAAGNPFNGYVSEILRAEGVRDVEVRALDDVSAGLLVGRKVVILCESAPTSGQITTLQNYVNAGGGLIVMKPTSGLTAMLGVALQSGSTSDAYFRITDGSIGGGLYSDTLQYHGAANRYTLAGATQVAQLYSSRTDATGNVAATIANYGAGRAAMFAFDIGQSVVLMRQGNPAFANVDRDGDGIFRTIDLYNGWVDRERSEVPQADMLQRLFVRLIDAVSSQPTPRIWYFPGTRRAVLVPTADSHANPESYYQAMVNAFSQRGVGLTFYLTTTAPPASVINGWRSQGFDFAVHPYVDGGYASGIAASVIDFISDYGFSARTARTHQVRWLGWDQAAEIEAQYGIEMDFNMYQWGTWLNKPGGYYHGYITGSGLPMRFVDASGNVLPIYLQHTTLVDEAIAPEIGSANLDLQTAMDISRKTIDDAISGYHTVVATQFHVDTFAWGSVNPWVLGTTDYAIQRGLQVIHADDWLTFTKQRVATVMSDTVWSHGVLSFNVAAGGPNQTVLVPLEFRGFGLAEVRVNGSPASYDTMTINGVNFAAVPATSGAWQATYNTDATPPVISAIEVQNIGTTTARVVWTTDEASNSVVDYGVGTALDLQASSPSMVTSHAIDLTALSPATQYSYRVTSVDAFGNSASSSVSTFTTATNPPPVVSSVSPASGSNASAVVLTISGSGFVSGATVQLNTTPLGNVQFVGSSTLQATVPAGFAVGVYHLTVTNPDGGSATLDAAYAVTAPPPVLTSVSPATVSAGATFTLNGSGFVAGATVRLGDTVIASSVQSDTTASATVPAGAASGVYSVSLTNPDGAVTTLDNALTVTALLSVSHTTAEQFAAGTLTQVQVLTGDAAGDGALTLASAGFSDSFDGTSLNSANWNTGLWDASGSVEVSGGTCALRGAWIAGRSAIANGTVTARITFPNSAWQNFGLSRSDTLDNPWLLFGVPGWDTSRVYARINVGSTYAEVPLTGLTGAPHDFTIEYRGAQVRFLVDGTLVHQATIPNAGLLVPWFSVGVVGAPLTVDAFSMASYVPSGSFLSAALDAGQNADWAQLSLQASAPAGTGVRARARSSSSGLAYSDWSSWSSSSPFDLSVPDGRYLQYELELTTSDAALSPMVNSVTATYQGSTGSPVGSVTVNPSSATLGAGGTQLFVATVLDNQGQPLSGIPVEWSIANGGGSISQTGLFTAGSTPGTYAQTVVATAQGVAGTASVTISQSAPTITSITPNSGLTDQQTPVAISGTNFQDGATARLSNVDLTNVQFVSASSLQAVVPAGLPAGPHDLTVTNPDGGAATRNAAFTAQAPAPTLASVSPAAANAGDEITLQGANFVSGAVVRIGAATVPSSVLAADQALATVPAGTAPGVYSVSITNPDGQSASLSNALTVTTLQTVSHTTLADFNAGTFAATQAVDGGNAGDGAVTLFSNGFVDLFDAPSLDSSVWASGVYTTGGAVGQSGGALSVSGAWARGRSVVPSGVFTARLTFTNSAWQNVGFSREDQLDDPWLVFGVPGWDTTRVFARINVGSTNADIPLTGLIGAPHDYTIEYSGTQVRFLVDGVQVHQATIPNPGFMAPWISQGSVAEPIIVEQAALASYVSSGTYLSAPLDAGADADWVQFVTQRVQPGGTTLRGRARSSVDGSTFSAWTGWSAAQQFDLAVPAGRYLQYELELTTSAATATPLVSSVAATYQPSGGPQAASVVVTPASATVQAGMTQQFAATVLDSAGQPIDGAAVTWDVVSGGGTVNSTGLFTAGSATGTFTNTVVATSNGVSGSASVTVSPLPPTITGVSPTSGPTTGNTDVTLSGTNFETGAIVRFGANAATNVSVSPTTITARTPVGTAGTVDVSVSMPSGATATLPGGYTYTAVPTAPVVSGVSPNSGPTTGGTTVTVTGSGFSGTTQVRFGTTNAPNYTVDSDEQITVISPSRSSGTVNIRVTNSVGVSPATAPSQYTYVPAPSISGVSPSSGPTTGGTQVNINGANFQPGATARFGDVQLTVVSSTSSRITVTTPPADAGLVDVIVTNPDGGQAIRSGGYRYVVPAPVVTGVQPATGPTAGGTSVVITGQYFTGATQVRFGATTAASFVVDSDSQITVISPSRSAGVVSVRVTTPSGTSPSSGAPTFTYIAPPNITAVSPNTGPAAGGTSVAITGTSFNEATAVHFGTVPATSFVLESTTRIVAVSPPQAAGRIDIRVTTPYGQSVIRSADRFTYV